MYECVSAIAHRYTPTRRPEEAVKRPLLLLSTFSFEARSLSLSGVHIFPARLKSSEPQISFCFDFPQNCGYVCVWTPVLLRTGVCSELELHLFVDPWLLVPWMLESELFTLQQLHLTAMPSLQPLWLTLISAFFFILWITIPNSLTKQLLLEIRQLIAGKVCVGQCRGKVGILTRRAMIPDWHCFSNL